MVLNDGKALESKLSATLKAYTSKQKGFNHRFPDTRTAKSGMLAAQPGDYMLLIPGHAVLIEAKSTTTGTPLLSLAFKNKVQIAQHKMWLRAGHPSFYLWMHLGRDIIEFHEGKNVVEKIDKPLFTGSSKQMMEGLKFILESLK